MIDEERKNEITNLVKTYYFLYNSLQKRDVEDLIKEYLDKYLDSNKSIQSIKEEIEENIDSLNNVDNSANQNIFIQNEDELLDILQEFSYLFKKNPIDYYIAGDVCFKLKYGTPHAHKLVFLINEDDLTTFNKMCTALGLEYIDNRDKYPRIIFEDTVVGECEISANSNNIRIDIQAYHRLDDNSIVFINYCHDDTNNMHYKRFFSPEFVNKYFDNEEVSFRDDYVKIVSPEFAFAIQHESSQDLDKYLDVNSVKLISNLIKEEKTETEVVTVDDNTPENSTKNHQIISNENGFVDNMVITNISLITFVIILIGIVLICISLV